MAIPTDPTELLIAKRQAKATLWRQGVLSWKFQDYPWAKDLYTFIRGKWGGPPLPIQIHRRGTKSTTCMIIGIEECLRTPHTTYGILCNTKDQARDIGDESLTAILGDCPPEVAPRKVKNDYTWVFDHNGSKIVILPAEKLSAKAGRGRKFRFLHVLEAAFIPGLKKLIRSILGPTLLDVTGKWRGQIVLESTPPDDSVAEEDVEFWNETWAEAEAIGNTFFLPLSKNKHASPEFVAACKAMAGGEHSEEYQREFELHTDARGRTTAIPEFQTARASVVRVVDRPLTADRYESLDPGGTHPTGELWGFYDFEQDLLVVEDEWLKDKGLTSDIVKINEEKEVKLWGPAPGGKLYRIADNNNQTLLRDLHIDHGLLFHATAKDDKDAQINKTRVMFRDNRIAIHPRCEILIKTLLIARRAKSKRAGFEEAKGIGHADLLDCLLYMVRNLRRHNMPEVAAPVGAEAEKRWVAQRQDVPDNAARKLSGLFRRGLRRW